MSARYSQREPVVTHWRFRAIFTQLIRFGIETPRTKTEIDKSKDFLNISFEEAQQNAGDKLCDLRQHFIILLNEKENDGI